MLAAMAKRRNLLVLARTRGTVKIQVLDLSRMEWVREFDFCPEPGADVDVGGLAMGEDGRLFLSDTGACTIWILNLFGRTIGRIGLPKSASTPRDRRGIPAFPKGLALDSEERLWVACGDQDQVHGLQIFSGAGRFEASVASLGIRTEVFARPEGIRIHEGRVWITEPFADRLQVFREDGSFVASYDVEDRAGVGRPFAIAPFEGGHAVLVREPEETLVLFDREMRPRKDVLQRTTAAWEGPVDLMNLEDGSLVILDELGERLRRLDLESGLEDWA